MPITGSPLPIGCCNENPEALSVMLPTAHDAVVETRSNDSEPVRRAIAKAEPAAFPVLLAEGMNVAIARSKRGILPRKAGLPTSAQKSVEREVNNDP